MWAEKAVVDYLSVEKHSLLRVGFSQQASLSKSLKVVVAAAVVGISSLGEQLSVLSVLVCILNCAVLVFRKH